METVGRIIPRKPSRQGKHASAGSRWGEKRTSAHPSKAKSRSRLPLGQILPPFQRQSASVSASSEESNHAKLVENEEQAEYADCRGWGGVGAEFPAMRKAACHWGGPDE